MVEELIAEILFEIDIADQKRGDQLFRQVRLSQECTGHRLFFNAEECGWRYCSRRADAYRLSDKCAFTEKIASGKHADDGFLSAGGNDRHFDLSTLNQVNGVGWTPLRIDLLALSEIQ